MKKERQPFTPSAEPDIHTIIILVIIKYFVLRKQKYRVPANTTNIAREEETKNKKVVLYT